nr:uncharacterized protein LOC118682677 [Bactrocera oleae]
MAALKSLFFSFLAWLRVLSHHPNHCEVFECCEVYLMLALIQKLKCSQFPHKFVTSESNPHNEKTVKHYEDIPFIDIFIYHYYHTEHNRLYKENYILIEEKYALIFEEYRSIYHLTNLSLFENDIQKYKTDTEIVLIDDSSMDSEICITETVLKLLMNVNKIIERGVTEIGTVWKWISGTSDLDDFIKIANK